jgi:hypothetical protein
MFIGSSSAARALTSDGSAWTLDVALHWPLTPSGDSQSWKTCRGLSANTTALVHAESSSKHRLSCEAIFFTATLTLRKHNHIH